MKKVPLLWNPKVPKVY